MNPINPVKNQYRGINAHLHSYWQGVGGWDSFHTNHVVDLMRGMNKQLMPMGYVADIEPSLQLQTSKQEDAKVVYDNSKNSSYRQIHVFNSGEAVAISELLNLDDEESEYRAVAIYETSKLVEKTCVVWIELMSPSNKGERESAAQYRAKRQKLLRTGSVFLEIDYLHESRSDFRFGSSAKEYPYHITVINPHPSFYEGLAYPYHFDVDEVIPTVEIPLNADDVFKFDFGIAYTKTLDETHYARRFSDYTQLPLNFDRYSPDDQARILNRMIAVIEASQQGINLESASPLLRLPTLET